MFPQNNLAGQGLKLLWASYQIRKIAGCACAGNAGNVFPGNPGACATRNFTYLVRGPCPLQWQAMLAPSTMQLIEAMWCMHYSDVIKGAIASQITSLPIVYLIVYSGTSQMKISKLRVTGLCAGNSPSPVNSPHKGPVTRKMFPLDDVIMYADQIYGLPPNRRHVII